MDIESASQSRPAARDGRERSRALMKFRLCAAAAAVLAALSIWGALLDRSIRPDPFAISPNWWSWLRFPQPHPALQAMPVVPIGARGALTFRPADTSWINWPLVEQPSTPAAQAASALIGKAQAEMLSKQPDNAQQSKAPEEAISAERFAAPPLSGVKGARILTAACLPDGSGCWIGADTGLFFRQPNALPIPIPDVNSQVLDIEISSNGKLATGIIGSPLAVIGSDNPSDPKSWQQYLTPSAAPASGSSSAVVLSGGGARSLWASSGQSSSRLASSLEDFWAAVRVTGTDTVHINCATVALTDKDGARYFSGDDFADVPRDLAKGNINQVFFIDRVRSTSDAQQVAPPGAERPSWFIGDKGCFGYSGPPLAAGALAFPRTTSNLRSIYFQDDSNIGWVSSGWGEDSDETPDQTGLARPMILQTLDGGANWARLSYRALPAPWVLYGALPLMFFAFYGTLAAWREIPPEPREAITGRATPDKPIGLDDPDVLGLKDLSQAIERFLRNSATEPPLTIAIEGKWGTGKSSLMNLVRQRLERRGERPVWFNAWHQQNDEQLFAALFENIRAQAIPPSWQLSGLKFRAKLLWMRVGRSVWGLLVLAVSLLAAWFVFHEWLPELWEKLVQWIEWSWDQLTATNVPWNDFLGSAATLLAALGAGLGVLGVVLKAGSQLFKALNADPAAMLATLSAKSKVSDYSDKLSFHYRFAREFNDTCVALQTRTGAGLVIFIDDLDRCSEEQVMRILGAVNFLATAGPCFIILGIDRDRVKERVNLAAKEEKASAYADRYLEKLFNMTIRVPEASSEATLALATGETAQADGSNNRTSVWPDRIRRVIRFAPEVATFPIAMLLAAFVLANVVPAPKLERQQGEASTNANANTTNTASGSQVTSKGEIISGETNQGVTPATVNAEKLKGPVPLAAWMVPLLAAAALALFALRRTALASEDLVEDSGGFLTAMRIWHPAIFALDPAPRAIKKHQNRLRFQAMRARPQPREPDWLDKLWGMQDQKPRRGTVLLDEQIVALGGIEAVIGKVPGDSAKAIETAIVFDKASVGHWPVLDRALREFKSEMPSAWPPSDDQISVYTGLAKITVDRSADQDIRSPAGAL